MNKIRLLIPDQRGPNITDAAPITTTGVYQNMHSNAALNLYPLGLPGHDRTRPTTPNWRNIGRHMSATNAYPPATATSPASRPNCLYAVDGDTATGAMANWAWPRTRPKSAAAASSPPTRTIDSTLWPHNRGALIYQAKIARTPYLLTHGPDANSVATNPMTVTQGTPVAADRPRSTTPGPATPSARTWAPPNTTLTPRPGPAAPPSR